MDKWVVAKRIGVIYNKKDMADVSMEEEEW